MDFFNYLKNNKLIILIVSIILNIILFFVGSYYFYNYYNYNCNCKITQTYNTEEKNVVNDSYYVEIKGAVNKPGVYKVESNNIINDVVKQAGGFTKKAYTNNINLSKKVSNELVIYVYTKSEYSKKDDNKIIQTICECPTYEIDSCIDQYESEIVVNQDNVEKDSSELEEGKDNSQISNNEDNSENNNNLININTATKDELMTLTGVGESKALAIIEYRTTVSKFKVIEDIKNVSGFGEKVFEKIKNNITV